MAYVLWRVVLKKYTKVRLGIMSNRPPVTPSDRAHSSKDAKNMEGEGAWGEPKEEISMVDLSIDDPSMGDLSGGEELSRSTLSKSKRVKHYLARKCRDVLSGESSRSRSASRRRRQEVTASWYVEAVVDSRTEGGGEQDVEDETEKHLPPGQPEIPDEPHPPPEHQHQPPTETAEEPSPTNQPEEQIRSEVEMLVDKHLGPVYPHYSLVRSTLVRQARDLLVTKYFGQHSSFETDFLEPAAKQALAIREQGLVGGWRLVVGGAVSLGLVAPPAGRGRVSLSLLGEPLPPPPLALLLTGMELAEMLAASEARLLGVSLEDLAFPPRPPAHDTCSCLTPLMAQVEKRDSSIQTCPMFEMEAGLPHIDSDDEHDIASVSRNSRVPVASSISDIPESHLMAGIHLPGLHDEEGRALVVMDCDGVSRVGLSPTECARIVLYYSTIPVRCERREKGLCLIALCSSDHLQLLDETISLLSERIGRLILYGEEDLPLREDQVLPSSHIKFVIAKDKYALERYVPADQVPVQCCGDTTHDQLQWIEFMKEWEVFMGRVESAGRTLVTLMGDLGSRRGLGQQTRTLSRLGNDPQLPRLRRDAPLALQDLLTRALSLPASEDVRFCVDRAEFLYREVDTAASRLEDLIEKRKEQLKDLARIRSLEHETEQVLSWLNQKGDDWLKRHSELATTLPALKQQEQDFERFYFISMRHLDKGGDLVEEAGQVSGSGSGGLRDLARTLKNHLRGFSDRLEDTRERLEDTSRCFYLLDRSYEWALEAMKYMSRVKPEDNCETSLKQLRQYLMAHPPPPHDHFTEMLALATKLDNDKLMQQCKVAQCRCEETLEQVRALIGCERVGGWGVGRRRSVGGGGLGDIAEEPPPLARSCTWQYSPEPYDEEDKLSGDASESTNKSSCEDVDEHSESCCGKTVSPIPVNSHLHNDLSVEVDSQCGTQTLKTKKTMLLIMREMIQTERDYVRSLDYVIQNYIPELVREDIPQALRGQRNVIFGNIEKIYEFHNQYFLKELERCEQNPLSVGQCFLRHENKFYLYALYNKNKPKSDSLMSEYGSSFFRAKQLELGDKMDLGSYLLKPVQRMGKYALLLQQLMKASSQGRSCPDLKEAEAMVRFQLRHGNDLLAMDSLRECDVNVKEQGRLLRQNEFLVWQGKGGKKYYRHVFLFEELILFSKARRFPDNKNLDIYIYKHSIKTSDIGLTAKVGDSSTKFEIWFRKRKPNDTFTLQSISEDIKQAWADELSNLLWKQALRNREMRLAEMSSMGIGNKPCLDIRPSANQISDRSISIAQLSKTAPRFRNSIAVSPVEGIRKRPHSIISVSSASSSSSSSSSSGGSSTGSGGSSTGSGGGLTRERSHCSEESGIVADWNASESGSSDTSRLEVKL